jgi:hypothetical protein
MPVKKLPAQSPRVRVTNVVDPALDTCIELGEGDASGLKEVNITFEASGKVYHVSALQFALRLEP